jgi:hypothetical protein
MNADDVRKLMHATPFVPFTVQLANGKNLRVPHPDFISISRTGRTLIIHSAERDDYDVVDTMLVTNINVERDVESAS